MRVVIGFLLTFPALAFLVNWDGVQYLPGRLAISMLMGIFIGVIMAYRPSEKNKTRAASG